MTAALVLDRLPRCDTSESVLARRELVRAARAVVIAYEAEMLPRTTTGMTALALDVAALHGAAWSAAERAHANRILALGGARERAHWRLIDRQGGISREDAYRLRSLAAAAENELVAASEAEVNNIHWLAWAATMPIPGDALYRAIAAADPDQWRSLRETRLARWLLRQGFTPRDALEMGLTPDDDGDDPRAIEPATYDPARFDLAGVL